DASRSAADVAVPAVEARCAAVVEVRHDDADGEREPESSGGDDPGPDRRPATGDCVPDPEPGDDEGDLLLRRCSEDGEHGEGHEAVVVQVAEGEEEQRAGEGDRMELVQR